MYIFIYNFMNLHLNVTTLMENSHKVVWGEILHLYLNIQTVT